jgi:hypothetical protein
MITQYYRQVIHQVIPVTDELHTKVPIFTDKLPIITQELPKNNTGIIISIHRLGKLYTSELVTMYFRSR